MQIVHDSEATVNRLFIAVKRRDGAPECSCIVILFRYIGAEREAGAAQTIQQPDNSSMIENSVSSLKLLSLSVFVFAPCPRVFLCLPLPLYWYRCLPLIYQMAHSIFFTVSPCPNRAVTVQHLRLVSLVCIFLFFSYCLCFAHFNCFGSLSWG